MGTDCGRAHFRHEAAARATLVGEQLPAMHRERRARALVAANDVWPFPALLQRSTMGNV